MNFTKYLILFFLILLLNTQLFSREKLSINFNNLNIVDFIKITAKTIDKNILIESHIDGKVNFISSKDIYKDEIFSLLEYILKSKGYEIVQKEGILTIVKFTNKFVEVVPLKNADAKIIIKTIEKVLKSKSSTKNGDTIFVEIDEETNSIILMGVKKQIKYFQELIKKLDSNRQQVYVQARIIELSETKTNNLGVQYGLNGFSTSSTGLMTFSSALNGSGVAQPLSLTELSGYGYSPTNLKSGISLGAAINLLKQNKALDVVSEPSILCINNKESSIYVGETRSIPTGMTVGTTTTTNYKREDIGLKLIVKPRISNSNKVTLQIQTILEDVKETNVALNIPNTNKKEVITTAIVNNGESVIIGGLIKNKRENTQEKVPLLGDIPILGNLFKNNYSIDDKINLVIIVTPYIVPKSKDLTFVRDQLAELKILEERYTKDLSLKLQELKIKSNKEDILREKKINYLKKEQKQIEYSDAEYKNKQLHQKRLKEIFGI